MPDPTPIHSPHDRFLKETFSRLETAASFFQQHLPPPLATVLDWSTLRLEPGSFVDEHLVGQCSDLLYTVHGPELTLGLYCLFLSQCSMDQFGGAVLERLALTLMKAVREGGWAEWLDRSSSMLVELLGQADQAGVVGTMLRYLCQADPGGGASTIGALASKVEASKLGETVMTLEEMRKEIGRREGLEKGRQEGRQEGHQQGLE